MIRALQKPDINRVADIWLDTNVKAQDFIPRQYWQSNFDLVKEMISQAEVYVYEHEEKIQGFIGLSDEYIAGIFVSDAVQSQGVGKRLLNFVKDRKENLRLDVYKKNTRAMQFYQREGFEIQCEKGNESTGEQEYGMIWSRK